MPTMKRSKRGLSASLLCLLCAVLLAAPSRAADPPVAISQTQAQALGIETLALATATHAAALTLPAQVAVPNDQIHAVAAPLPGLIQSLGAAPGQSVKRGQVLARIASPMLLEVQRDYLNAASQAQLASNSARRDEQLWREGIIAESRYQATKSAQAQAAVALAERRQALRLAGLPDHAIAALSSGKTMNGVIEVVSPIDGEVLGQAATVGNRAEQSALLYKVARLDPLLLEIQVPLKLAADLREGARVRVSGSNAAGKVIAIGRQVNADNQTVSVRALITEGAANLRPGQFMEAELDVPAHSASAWRVPAAAVVRQQEKSFVFVQQGSGFAAVEVQLAGQAGDQVLITAADPTALKANDRIAVKGLSALKAAWMGIGKE